MTLRLVSVPALQTQLPSTGTVVLITKSCMIKSKSIHQRDSKGIVKFNFVMSCLAFRRLIPIVVRVYD